MSHTIFQQVYLPATPAQLYGAYLNGKKHAAVIGHQAMVEPHVGGKFAAFGMLEGTFLALRKNKLIVQTWRSRGWKTNEPDSILILRFESYRKGARIELTHANIPEYDYDDINEGWKNYYWRPWKNHLRSTTRSGK